jgi:anti-anti-sigma factor
MESRIAGDEVIIDLTQDAKLEGLSTVINDLLDQGHLKIVLNLEGVSYIDSIGLGNIVHASKAVSKRGGQLKLVGMNKRMRDLIAITNYLTKLETSHDRPPGPFPDLDPFNPSLHGTYWKAGVAAVGLILIAIIFTIIRNWEGVPLR